MQTPRDHNPELTRHARSMRANPTDAEQLIWARLRDGRFDGWRFRRQRPSAGYIVDFYCPRAKLVIEIDDGQHDTDEARAYDARRTAALQSLGLCVLRFWSNDVLARPDAVMAEIHDALTATLSSRAHRPMTIEDRVDERLREPSATHTPPTDPLPVYREREVENREGEIEIWNAIATYWDEKVGEGNDFQKQLVMPATDRLMDVRPGQVVLDACCGNGNYSRRLGRRGAKVIAFDGASAFIEIARQKTTKADGDIAYHVADATDQKAVESLATAGSIDAAVCSFALMDLPAIDPLLKAVASLLKPGGRFVWSVGHPAFHTNESEMTARQDHGQGEPTQTFGVNVTRYLSDWPHPSRGILGQPRPHWIYHRSMSTLLHECFKAGFVVDGMEEPSFPPDTRARSPFSWARRPEIPPALIVRLRRPV
jgi:very-short-patch-repair endonuclease/2-polyprenyl-3-methyl-5-hydroxy-6-metoxy-1,4-benzoquinol methylase